MATSAAAGLMNGFCHGPKVMELDALAANMSNKQSQRFY